MFEITWKELRDLIAGGYDRFEIIQNSIPIDDEEDRSNYIEDDGREYRFFHFKDLKTDEEYGFSYVWHREHPFDHYSILSDLNECGIKIVAESTQELDRYQAHGWDNPEPLPAVTEPIVPEVVLTPEQQADKELCDAYHAVEAAENLQPDDISNISDIPQADINAILKFLRTETKFSLIDLRKLLFPLCIKYKVHQKSLWAHIQRAMGNWK